MNGKKVVIEVERRDESPISICAEFKYCELYSRNALYMSYVIDGEELIYTIAFDTYDYYSKLHNGGIDAIIKYMCESSAPHLEEDCGLYLTLVGNKLTINERE